MCRLFGFKSIINSQVHSSLVAADNALGAQSVIHPDGWGVAYFQEDIPHIIKSSERAFDDHIFQKVSGVVSSQTVLAHIRKATHGKKTILNSHPFQYGHWVFAHNGHLKNFDQYKHKLKEKILPDLRRFILGDTDSEIIFYLLLSYIQKNHSLKDPAIYLSDLKEAIQDCCQFITSLSGPLSSDAHPDPKENHLTFILTTGKVMAGIHGGQPLKYSTYKKKCPERDSCPFFEPRCESIAGQNNSVNHLLFSSEALKGENIWQDLEPGDLVAVDQDMKFLKLKIKLDLV